IKINKGGFFGKIDGGDGDDSVVFPYGTIVSGAEINGGNGNDVFDFTSVTAEISGNVIDGGKGNDVVVGLHSST
ncbi:MAG: hypothetical protein CMP10_21330, partial [Zetaproteobacteria bacterium]|nr:hypothetical protein [Pseudobdellovibrionaceae bacterium]